MPVHVPMLVCTQRPEDIRCLGLLSLSTFFPETQSLPLPGARSAAGKPQQSCLSAKAPGLLTSVLRGLPLCRGAGDLHSRPSTH